LTGATIGRSISDIFAFPLQAREECSTVNILRGRLMIDTPERNASEPQLWPVFICYRQVDGLAAARRLHELLDKREVTGPKGELIRLDVYLDQTMPAVADWREIHRPYLEKARAIIVVCTPGAKINEGPNDWVHKEISWWLEHRKTVPILIDPLRQGVRYVPIAIYERWPEIQRIPLVEAEWSNLPAAALEEKAKALRRQIVGNILPSGAAIYAEELETERKRAEGLQVALQGRTRALRWLGGAFAAAVVLSIAVGVTAKYAFDQQDKANESSRVAEINRRISQASLYDAEAASLFSEARRYDARWDAEKQRQLDIDRDIKLLPQNAPGARKQNLQYERQQLDETMSRLAARAAVPRRQGFAQLKAADSAWKALEESGQSQASASRKRPQEPAIFSVELINSGSGESILIHYGTPDATRLVMVNGGARGRFNTSVAKRLQSLRTQRFAGEPVPIELFVVSDQDDAKSGGLLRLLQDQANVTDAKDRLAALHLVWANIFSSTGFRGEIRGLLRKAGMALNAPFDHLVMRPDNGQLVHRLGDGEDGLEIIVLGPERKRVRDLYEFTRGEEDESGRERFADTIESFPEEAFSRMKFTKPEIRLNLTPAIDWGGRCKPSENAAAMAKVELRDQSRANLASTVLLFRYRGRTFLHTGDSRADLIMDSLRSSTLLEDGKSMHVDLLHLPHLGSDGNLTPQFLERVTANNYLFTGDGTFSQPKVETIASVIAARPCADYTMYFVNRDSSVKRLGRDLAQKGAKELTHAESLDIFFAAEEQYNPRYRRVFRETDQGSVVIDLLDRMTY
jgi:hypothetical protein